VRIIVIDIKIQIKKKNALPHIVSKKLIGITWNQKKMILDKILRIKTTLIKDQILFNEF